MPAPRQKEPEMMATAEPSPAPRLKCSNEQCEYLASLDTEKMGSFCCKKCHLHFSGGARKLKHGDFCKKEVAPSELERAPTIIEPKVPMDSQVTSSSKPAKKKWNEHSKGRYTDGTWNEPVDEKLDGIWKMTEEDRQHTLLQQKNQIEKMRLTLRNPKRHEDSPMTDASSSKTTDREENGRETIRRIDRRSRPRAPHSETALQLHGISGNPSRSTGSRSHRDVAEKRQRPRPDSFPMTYPNDLEDGECSPSRPRERSRSRSPALPVAIPRGTVGRMFRATDSRSHQDLDPAPDQRHERRERTRRRRHDPRPTLPVHPESLPRSYPRDDQDGEREVARRADSRSPSARATASRHHIRSFVIYHARVGSETESEDSDWTVRTSSTVVRAEVMPGPKPCDRWERAEEGSRKSTEMRHSATGRSDAPEALGLRQLPPREPASLGSRHGDRKETRSNGGRGRSRSRDGRASSRGGPGRGSGTRHLKESHRPIPERPSPERYGSDHPRGRHRATHGTGDTQRRRSQEHRTSPGRFDVFRAKEGRPLNDGNHRESGRAREFSANMIGTRTVDREPDSRARSNRSPPGNSATARKASVESNYSYYSDCYYSSSEDPPTRSRTEVQQNERRRSGDRMKKD